jgi:outer membrane immunogenic protein
MKRLATAIAAIALIGTPAFAAAIAVKGPPSPPPAPVYNWTGFYVGGNIGASFGHAKTDYNIAPVTLLTGTPPSTPVVTIPGFAGSAVTEPAGVIGGGQIGYNWQFSPILVAGGRRAAPRRQQSVKCKPGRWGVQLLHDRPRY